MHACVCICLTFFCIVNASGDGEIWESPSKMLTLSYLIIYLLDFSNNKVEIEFTFI